MKGEINVSSGEEGERTENWKECHITCGGDTHTYIYIYIFEWIGSKPIRNSEISNLPKLKITWVSVETNWQK